MFRNILSDDFKLVAATFPGASVAIIIALFVNFDAIGTNENPLFFFFYLDAVHGGVFLATAWANFCFHNPKTAILENC